MYLIFRTVIFQLNRNRCANFIRIEASVLEEAVLSAVEEHALTPEAIARVLAFAERDEIQEQRGILEAEQKEITRKLGNMVKAIAEGNSPGILLEAMRELENRQTEIAA